MIAATKVGVPAPKVRAILEPADGLGRGYITDRVEGETLGQRDRARREVRGCARP